MGATANANKDEHDNGIDGETNEPQCHTGFSWMEASARELAYRRGHTWLATISATAMAITHNITTTGCQVMTVSAP